MSEQGKWRNPRAKNQALRRRTLKRRAVGFRVTRTIRNAPKPLSLLKCTHEPELTDAETTRQDQVDNAIHKLLNELRPDGTSEIPWCIECIAVVRDAVRFALRDHCDEFDAKAFYPRVEDDALAKEAQR